MNRFAVLSALALAALLPAPALAQPGFGDLRIVDVKAEKGKLKWTQTEAVPVEKEIAVEVDMNGKKVIVKKKVTVHEMVNVTKEAELKAVRVTDAAGKAVEADKLAERLKEPTPVVIAFSALTPKQRALFKDTTLFFDFSFPLPKGPVEGPGGPAPISLPPEEK